jgi:hypothetical protein
MLWLSNGEDVCYLTARRYGLRLPKRGVSGAARTRIPVSPRVSVPAFRTKAGSIVGDGDLIYGVGAYKNWRPCRRFQGSALSSSSNSLVNRIPSVVTHSAAAYSGAFVPRRTVSTKRPMTRAPWANLIMTE